MSSGKDFAQVGSRRFSFSSLNAERGMWGKKVFLRRFLFAGHSVTLADCPRMFPRGPGEGGSMRHAVMSGEERFCLTVHPEGLTVQPGSMVRGLWGVVGTRDIPREFNGRG